MSPKRVDKEQKRRSILQAAMHVFARQSVYDFKVIDIAREAAVGKGTIYEYFNTKDALIDGCIDLFMRDLTEYLAASTDPGADPPKQLDQFLTATFDFFASEPTRVRLIFDLWAVMQRRHRDLPGQTTLPHYLEARNMLAAAIKRGTASKQFRPVEPIPAASLIMAALDGVLFQAALGMTNIEDRSTVNKMKDTLLRGILK